MVIRIEYLLLLLLVILVFSIMGINPSSQSAIQSQGDKEIFFQKFSLFELKEGELGKQIFASETTKYVTHLDLKNIHLNDEDGHVLLANKATYQNNSVFLEENITLTANNGLMFSTESLNYELKEKIAMSSKPFLLDFNGSTIRGKNLAYSIKTKEVSADSINASILFVSKNTETTLE